MYLYANDRKALDDETREKLNEATKKIFKTQFEPEALAEVQKEITVILTDHPELLETTNNMMFKDGAWDKMRDYVQEQAAKGTPFDWEKERQNMGDRDPLFPEESTVVPPRQE